MTPEGRERIQAMMKGFNRFENVKARPLSERCLIGFGSTAGPPMMPVLYNNNYQIVQTADTIMILVEMVHDVRVIRMNQKHVPPEVRKWLGDSVGHWEGDTLVVDTANLNGKTWLGEGGEIVSHAEHVVERFTPTDSGTLQYEATVTDPIVYARPWTMAFPMKREKFDLIEAACHEEDHDLPHLKALKDAAAAQKK